MLPKDITKMWLKMFKQQNKTLNNDNKRNKSQLTNHISKQSKYKSPSFGTVHWHWHWLKPAKEKPRTQPQIMEYKIQSLSTPNTLQERMSNTHEPDRRSTLKTKRLAIKAICQTGVVGKATQTKERKRRP